VPHRPRAGAVGRGAGDARRRGDPAEAPPVTAVPAIQLRTLGMQFPGVRALHGVSLDLQAGEVLGLVGENGAGKSTLIRILGGVHPAGSYQGEVAVDGVVRGFRSTRDARAAGVAVVHQELCLVPERSIADNLLLGREPGRLGVVDDLRAEVAARALLREVELDLDVHLPVSSLGVGVQQLLEIARALGDRARVIVLDEPTAALTEGETARLLHLIRARRDAGASFVYISHRLEEIRAICDRVAVLRDGALVAVLTDPTIDELVTAMTGCAVHDAAQGARRTTPRAPVLQVRDLTVAHPTRGRNSVEGLSFEVGEGEVVALAGAMGSGRTATLSALFGLAKRGMSGEIRIDGKLLAAKDPADAIACGVALVPEDRKGAGLVLGLGVADNLAMCALGRLSKRGVVDGPRAEAAAVARARELRIKAAGLGADVATLSGGNQQKVVIGKWLELSPRLLLLDEPTRGVDVGAKAEIYKLIEELTARGHAVLLASSDLPEILRLADRVLVLREGRLAGTLDRADATQLAIMRLAVGDA